MPAELGGSRADVAALADMLRRLAHGCGSSALAFAMHTHQVAIPAWRRRNPLAAKAAVEPLLRRIATERIVIMSSGGSDWVGGSGKAEKVEGGDLRKAGLDRIFRDVQGALPSDAGRPAAALHRHAGAWRRRLAHLLKRKGRTRRRGPIPCPGAGTYISSSASTAFCRSSFETSFSVTFACATMWSTTLSSKIGARSCCCIWAFFCTNSKN